VLALNAVIGFVQERKAERSVRGLMHLVAPHARVIREGREWDAESRELVPRPDATSAWSSTCQPCRPPGETCAARSLGGRPVMMRSRTVRRR
jgi:hypothetical protein